MVKIKIEKKDYKHISHQIREQIRGLIESNHFQENEVLPPVSWFRKSLDVSQKPIRKALLELREEGLVYSKKGSGWYVSGKSTERFSDTDNQALGDALKHMPLAFIVKKRTARIALTDHPMQTAMWRKVFDGFEETNQYTRIEIETNPEKSDIRQLPYRHSRDKAGYENLLQFRSIGQIDFPDIFQIFLKAVRTPDSLFGLPSTICLPLIYVHKKWSGEFSTVIKKERISWNDYFKSLLAVAKTQAGRKNNFVLSALSPLIYFIANGEHPFEVRTGKVKTHFDEPGVASVLRDLETMGRKGIYVERENDQKILEAQKLFSEGGIPVFEGYSFHRHFLAEAKARYQLMPFPFHGQGRVPVNCSYWAVPKSAGEKELSAEIIRYLLSKEAQQIIAEYNTMSVLRSVAHSDKFSPPEYESKKIQLAILEQGEDLSGRDDLFYDYLEKYFNREVDKLINRLQTCEETIENLRRYAEELNNNKGG